MGKIVTRYALSRLQNGSLAGVLYVDGSIDSLNVKIFEKDAMAVAEAGALHLILDFEKLEYMNSTGLGALVKILDYYEERGGMLLIAQANDRILDLFEMLGIAPVVRVFSSLKEAMGALPSPVESKATQSQGSSTQTESNINSIDEPVAEMSDDESFDSNLAETAMVITSPDDELATPDDELPANLFDSIESQQDLEDMMSSDLNQSIAESPPPPINKIETIGNIDSDHFGAADSEMVVAMDTIDAIKAIEPEEKPVADIPTGTIDLGSMIPAEADTEDKAPKQPQPAKQPPSPKAKSKKRSIAPAPVSGQTMELPQGKRSKRREVLSQEKISKTYKRQSNLRHYEVMNPMKSYPLSIAFTKHSVKEIRVDSVRQVGGPGLEVSKDQPFVVVSPHMPGCVVNPSSITLDITPEVTTANFSVIPILEGSKNGTVLISQDNRVVKNIDFSFQVEKKTWAKVGAVAAVTSPLLSLIFDSLAWNTDKVVPGFFQYMNNNYGVSFIVVGIVLTILFAIVGLLFHFKTKEKEAEEQELMLEWETLA